MVRVLVKGFVSPYSEEVLLMLFRPFGTVCSIKTRGCSVVVDYGSRDEAEHAICVLQFKTLADSSVLVLDLFYNPEKRVAVRNEYPADRVAEAMAWFGDIYNVKETPGYIYVDYYDRMAAKKALEFSVEVNSCGSVVQHKDRLPPGPCLGGMGDDSGGRRFLKVGRMPCVQVPSQQTLFIYNLSRRCSENDLYSLFGRYGEILSCGVKEERGYVNFSRKEAVLRAYKYMDGKMVRNCRIRLKIKGQPGSKA